MGLIPPRLLAPEPCNPGPGKSVRCPQGRCAAEPPCQYRAGPEEEDLYQHLQETRARPLPAHLQTQEQDCWIGEQGIRSKTGD